MSTNCLASNLQISVEASVEKGNEYKGYYYLNMVIFCSLGVLIMAMTARFTHQEWQKYDTIISARINDELSHG